jgi:hypothetical protein
MRAGEEVRHGLSEVPQRLLLRHLAPGAQPLVSRPCFRKLPTLLRVARCAVATRTPPRLLLNSEVPNEPRMRAVPSQGCLLRRRRHQTIAGHAKTLSSTADISGR